MSDGINAHDWFEYFQSLYNAPTHVSREDIDIINQIKNLEKQPCFTEINYRITISEVNKDLHNLKKNKAVGLDGIANEMLKAGANKFSKPLTLIFNRIFSMGQYPREWCDGVISTIYKNGDPKVPGNHRAITICSNLAKVFSSILNERLSNFVEDNGLRPREQIGFKKLSRTTDHMFVLKTLIEVYRKPKGGKLYACFVDFSKAFDKVWSHGLLYKLLKSGIGGNFFAIIKSMYSIIKEPT